MAEATKEAEEILEAKEQPGPPVEEGIPAWMATFADMVTLLLCFFVLLLSFTTQDISNFRKLMGSVQEALGVQKEDKGAMNAPYAQVKLKFPDSKKKNREMIEVGVVLKRMLRAKDLQRTARVSNQKSGVMLSVGNTTMFPRGSASLSPQSHKVLETVIATLKRTKYNLIIRGHTDGNSVESDLYSSNWELSAARAAACLRYILTHSEIKPTRMKAVGYASAKPLLPSTTQANRAKNRRVEFYFVPNDNRNW